MKNKIRIVTVAAITILILLFCKANIKAQPVAGISRQMQEYIKIMVLYQQWHDRQMETEIEETEIYVEEEENTLVQEKPQYILVDSTAYYNKYDRLCTDGTIPEYGTLAGKIEWLGKQVKLYRVSSDGSVGEYIGLFTFHDLGYGQSTGTGSSYVLPGLYLGTIETGECIDIFMSQESDCWKYGRKKVYMQFLN
jgi:3D (Asp-Asp-Asp) domain-containing protein